PVPLLAGERADARLGRDAGRVFELGYRGAAAVGAVAPAVVGADQLVTADPAEGQRSAPVHAQVGVGPRPAGLTAPQYQRLAEQIGVRGPVGEVTPERDRVPGFPQRNHVGEGPRSVRGAALPPV